MALGITSLLLCPMLTWSLGCTLRASFCVAKVAITSLAFMLVLVPEPVWKMSNGKCASWSPRATSSAASWIAEAMSASRSPRSWLTAAAAPLINPNARKNVRGKGKPLMGKFSTALCVWAPQRASTGT